MKGKVNHMKEVEKYTFKQAESWVKKFNVGKATSEQMVIVINKCDNTLNRIRVFSLVVNSKNVNQFTVQDFRKIRGLPHFFSDVSTRQNSRKMINTRDKLKNNIGKIFHSNFSFSEKEELMNFFLASYDESNVPVIKGMYTAGNNLEEVIDLIYKIEKNNSYSKAQLPSAQIHLVKLIMQAMTENELNINKKLIFKKVSLLNNNFDDIKNEREDKKLFFETFSEFLSREQQYIYIKNVIKNQMGWRIENLMKEPIPFGLCVKAFVEIYSKDVASIEPEMEDQLDAAMVAVKLISNF